MDEFLNTIEECLNQKGFTTKDLLDDTILKVADKTSYKLKDKELIRQFKEVYETCDIKKLLEFIYKHQNNIHILNLSGIVSINIYSHNEDIEWPIDGYTIRLEEGEQKIVDAYETLMSK